MIDIVIVVSYNTTKKHKPHTSEVGAGVGADLDLLLPPPFAGYNTDAAIDIDASDSLPTIVLRRRRRACCASLAEAMMDSAVIAMVLNFMMYVYEFLQIYRLDNVVKYIEV